MLGRKEAASMVVHNCSSAAPSVSAPWTISLGFRTCADVASHTHVCNPIPKNETKMIIWVCFASNLFWYVPRENRGNLCNRNELCRRAPPSNCQRKFCRTSSGPEDPRPEQDRSYSKPGVRLCKSRPRPSSCSPPVPYATQTALKQRSRGTNSHPCQGSFSPASVVDSRKYIF